ncbi:MAG TPA: SpoIID/LytB domain-containing protein [Gaiellaceae bacterium]|nr:SpoIID/LytB domain-containing protein [Gaiellaceae bacterium]
MGRRALGLVLFGGIVAALVGGSSRAATTQPATLAARTVLVLSGHGYGHGLGMSQWGAYGYAQHGWTYDRILNHYYVGTTLGTSTVSSIRVLLTQEKQSTLTSTAPWSVADAAHQVVQLTAGTPVVLGADLSVNGQALTPPLTFKSAQPLSLDGKAYRGRLVVSLAGNLVQAVDVVGLEAYVKGVVPAEMPANWAPEAVKAQAVAARSYALANAAKDKPFDVYGDGRSQVYGGVAAESPLASAAVDATKHQVVLYAGKPADTMFFSSSGGRTASSLETTGVGVPYLQSVVDQYDTIAPYHDWGPMLFDLARVQKALRLKRAIVDLKIAAGTSPRAKRITATLSDGTTTTFTGNTLRAALDLRSTWITPQLLALQPPKALPFGTSGTLGGFARYVTGPVTLESRAPGAAWTAVETVTPAADGTFSVSVDPSVTTQYRLTVGTLHVAYAKVGVAPLLSVDQSATGVSGALEPAVSGAAVALQQQSGTTWATVSSTVTDTSGAWSFGGQLAPGTYRVRSTPGHGYVAAVSPPLVVQ